MTCCERPCACDDAAAERDFFRREYAKVGGALNRAEIRLVEHGIPLDGIEDGLSEGPRTGKSADTRPHDEPLAESDTCPSCGSAQRVLGLTTCPDSWHGLSEGKVAPLRVAAEPTEPQISKSPPLAESDTCPTCGMGWSHPTKGDGSPCFDPWHGLSEGGIPGRVHRGPLAESDQDPLVDDAGDPPEWTGLSEGGGLGSSRKAESSDDPTPLAESDTCPTCGKSSTTPESYGVTTLERERKGLPPWKRGGCLDPWHGLSEGADIEARKSRDAAGQSGQSGASPLAESDCCSCGEPDRPGVHRFTGEPCYEHPACLDCERLREERDTERDRAERTRAERDDALRIVQRYRREAERLRKAHEEIVAKYAEGVRSSRWLRDIARAALDHERED